jgi:hypothetical protein
VKHLVEFERQLKVVKASIKKLCEGYRNALLALSVKQVHAGKQTINRLSALREQPLHFIADKRLYEQEVELEEACTAYYNAYRKQWTEVDSSVVHNLIFHYVYDERTYCEICEKVLCDFRADKAFEGTQCETYAILCAVAGLTSDLRADKVRCINSLFPIPLLQDAKGEKISLFQLQRDPKQIGIALRSNHCCDRRGRRSHQAADRETH